MQMGALDSCYFCGEAVGASLEEYDVSRDAADPVTTTLCARCAGKLEELFERADRGRAEIEAADRADASPEPSAVRGSAGQPTRSGVEEAAAESTEEAGAEGPTGDEAPTEEDADSTNEPAPSSVTESVPTDRPQERAGAEESVEPSGDTRDERTAAGTSVDPGPVAAEPEPIFEGDAESVLDGEEGVLIGGDAGPPTVDLEAELPDDFEVDEESEGVSVADADASTASVEDPIAVPPTETEADEPTRASTGAQATDQSAEGDRSSPSSSSRRDGGEPLDDEAEADATPEPQTPDESGTAEAGSEESSEDDGPLADVSPRTYNRVVRLLQNREFPVDREDFEVLATSAYELDHGECAAALDGAIEKGLLVERDGELHRPD